MDPVADLSELAQTGAAPVANFGELAAEVATELAVAVAAELVVSSVEAPPVGAARAGLGALSDAHQMPAGGEWSEASHDGPGPPRRRRAGRIRHDAAAAAPGGSAEPDEDVDPEFVARAICLRLLTDRARTRQELTQALRRRGVPEEAANVVLERFGEVGLIDDAAFAGQWVRSRHAVRGLGQRALAVELRRKGVADDVAGAALAEVDAEAEDRRARELVDRKLQTIPVDTEERRAAAGRRLLGMLARKGYGADTAYRVVRQALVERGAEIDQLGEVDQA